MVDVKPERFKAIAKGNALCLYGVKFHRPERAKELWGVFNPGALPSKFQRIKKVPTFLPGLLQYS
jgi:intergrase/recombinase